MMLISISVVFPLSYNPSEFSVATLGVLMIFLVMHAWIRPYHESQQVHGFSLNKLDDIAQAVPLGSCMLALGLLETKNQWIGSAICVLLIIALMNIFTITVLAYFFVHAVREDASTMSVLH